MCLSGVYVPALLWLGNNERLNCSSSDSRRGGSEHRSGGSGLEQGEMSKEGEGRTWQEGREKDNVGDAEQDGVEEEVGIQDPLHQTSEPHPSPPGLETNMSNSTLF